MNLSKNFFYIIFLLAAPLFIVSCDKDDNHDSHIHVVAPATYEFERNGESSVSFSGQTCRLQMATDIYNAMNEQNAFTAAEFETMFSDGTGFDFAYDCGKNIGSKTSAGQGSAVTVRQQFIDMFTALQDVYANWDNIATNGTAGYITTSGNSTYQVDSKGLEIDQAFIKGLMGAFVVDQISNNYITALKLDGGCNDPSDAACLDGDPYTEMEHYWDEGYGYLYGYNNEHVGGTDNNANGPAEGKGVLVNKYLKKLNDGSHPGIANTIYDAFKLGRAAIVAGDYIIRDEQAAIIMENLDKIIAQKAIDYLSGAASTLADGGAREDTFHGLSEGYGFVLSLQYTSYFTNSEVTSMLDQMMEGDGFWNITVDELNTMVSQIQSVSGL
tara:strand:+ start:837 stop:1988 length:1152 start_codon:yes stop_codon:yes gene_type:complete